MSERDDDRPRKKKKKKQEGGGKELWIILGVVFGIALIVGVVILVIMLKRDPGAGPGNGVVAKGNAPEAPAQGVEGQAAKGQPGHGSVNGGIQVKGNAPKGLVQNVRAAAYRPMRQNELKQIGLFFVAFADERNGKPPASEDEFVKYIQRDAREIAQAIQEKYYILNLKVNMRDSNGIIAYESLVDTGGVYQAVRVDGSVSGVTEDDLRKAVGGK